MGDLPPELEPVVDQLAATRWPADVFDVHWRLVWVSDSLKEVLGERSEEALGYGEHILVARQRDAWQRAIAPPMRRDILLRNAAYWMHDTPGGRDAFLDQVSDDLRPFVERIKPAAPPPVWAWEVSYQAADPRPVRAAAVAARLHDAAGTRIGAVTVFGPGISARLFTMLIRGDERLFERMAALSEPAERRAAILFADLESSTPLSQRLGAPRYFELIRQLMTAADDAVIERGGLVGKHVGDGVTALFPAGPERGESAAARAAIEAAREIGQAGQRVAREVLGDPSDAVCRVNAGLHWGRDLYIGQVVTGGRLEVTALGEAVNQAARLEQSAHNGELLASEALVSRLERDDRAALGLDAERLSYRAVGDLAGAGDKALRDAGDIRVTDLRV
jgi:class 3 adenylate cyclase